MQSEPRLALCLEQTLGHRAHGLTLEAAAVQAGAAIHRVEYDEHPRLPAPWALRGSWYARQALRRAEQRADVALFHTSTISLFGPRIGSRYVVSTDATPLQVDAMGRWYAHAPGPALAERAKRAWYRHAFGRAAALVAWSRWAARSLVADYGVDSSRILVAHPGAPQPFFDIQRPRKPGVRILFVGGDFERKGGDLLLEAFEPLADRAALTIVTDAPVAVPPGVTRLSGIRPGTPEQLAAFAEADIFCLPTRGDCTPVVFGEAMAAGLPIVTTLVGSNAETVADRETGLLIQPGDGRALGLALAELVADRGLRERMGVAARAHARDRMDAAVNAGRIIEWMRAVA